MVKAPKKLGLVPDSALCLHGGCAHPKAFHTEIGCVGHDPLLDFESTATCAGACPAFLDSIPVVEVATDILEPETPTEGIED